MVRDIRTAWLDSEIQGKSASYRAGGTIAIVQLEGKIEIPIKVEILLAMLYPDMDWRRRLFYSTVFRLGMMFGKRIELWV
jgi:hypothetical protein